MHELTSVEYTPESPLRNPVSFVNAMFADLSASRELAWRLLLRSIKAMYRQTAFGYVWAFLPPLLTAFTWILINRARVFPMGETSVPYPLYVLVGTMLWQVFVDAINAPLRIVQQSLDVLAKMSFPREALILAGIGEVVFNFLLRLIPTAAALLYFRVPLRIETLYAIPGIIAIILLGTMLGLLLTPAGVLYKDVQMGVVMITQPWLYLTPVVYPVPQSGIMALVTKLNPVSPLIVNAREFITTGETVALLSTFIVLSVTLVLLLFGWVLYRVAMPRLIERMAA
jgi:lipopolysaccharide transport system permease protein